MRKNALATEADPRTPLGELILLP